MACVRHIRTCRRLSAIYRPLWYRQTGLIPSEQQYRMEGLTANQTVYNSSFFSVFNRLDLSPICFKSVIPASTFTVYASTCSYPQDTGRKLIELSVALIRHSATSYSSSSQPGSSYFLRL